MKLQTMSHRQQTTIFGIVFWTLFLASVGLGDHHWLQAAWLFIYIGFPAIGVVFSIVEMCKNRPDSNLKGYYFRRWMMWVVADDEQYEKYLQRRGLTAG